MKFSDNGRETIKMLPFISLTRFFIVTLQPVLCTNINNDQQDTYNRSQWLHRQFYR